jgi:ribosomal-protein-alanine N-acetyltransferase
MLIGTIGFYRNNLNNHRGEVGYMLEQKYWRNGYMNEALCRILDFGFYDLKFHSIEACINPDNDASRAILLKNNFVKEAYFKENFYYDGKFTDTEVYSLLTPIR